MHICDQFKKEMKNENSENHALHTMGVTVYICLKWKETY